MKKIGGFDNYVIVSLICSKTSSKKSSNVKYVKERNQQFCVVDFSPLLDMGDMYGREY